MYCDWKLAIYVAQSNSHSRVNTQKIIKHLPSANQPRVDGVEQL